jgi:hypothetical protein
MWTCRGERTRSKAKSDPSPSVHFAVRWTPVEEIAQKRCVAQDGRSRTLTFKALKHNLKIKTFVGTSANALKIQIWTALIALLLVRYLQLRSRLQWHLSRFVALLRHQLFVYRDLWRFLDNPFEGPPPLRKDYIDPQPSLFSWNQTGPPEITSTSPNGQPQIQNAELNAASPLLSIQPQPVSS